MKDACETDGQAEIPQQQCAVVMVIIVPVHFPQQTYFFIYVYIHIYIVVTSCHSLDFEYHPKVHVLKAWPSACEDTRR